MSKACGCCLGLVAFAVTLLVGAYVDNPLELVLSQAVAALLVFFMLGQLAGAVASYVLNEHYQKKLNHLEGREE